MDLNSYEAKVLGKDLYLATAKKHNLTTKKWTLGRLREFQKEIKELMKKIKKGK